MSKQVVLLLFPKVGVNPLRPQAPVSLLAIAPYLEEEGLNPVIIDQRIEKNYVDKIKELLPHALFVGITSMTGEQLTYAVELIRLVKSILPDSPIVFGGIHASMLPEQVIQQHGVNMAVVGEGESVIKDIADYYKNKTDIRNIKGIYYKVKNQIFSTPPRELMDLEKIKMPSWHLIDKNKYSEFGIQCGRGCYHKCTFCYNIKYNQQKWRFKKSEAIIEEIKFLHFKYKIKKIIFLDDNFFTKFDRVAEICELIISNNITIKWSSTCRSDYYKRFTPEFIHILKRSGMETLFVGGESGSPEILKRIKKGITVEDNKSMAEVAKKYTLDTVVSFMSGFPYETKKDRYMTYDLMDDIHTMSPVLTINGANVFTPYPGNDLFEESKMYGLVAPDTISGWSNYVFNMSNLPWLTKSENKMLENISFITRFYFWNKNIKARFLKAYYYPFYWFLRASAIIRWRLRFFTFAFEWDMFRIIRKRFLE